MFIRFKWISFVLPKPRIRQTRFVDHTSASTPDITRKLTLPELTGSTEPDCFPKP